MNQDIIDKLTKGIYLERSNQLLAWRAPFEKLKDLGNPEFRQTSDQRVDLIWKNENILNGITVDLIIMRWFGLSGMNKKFKYAHAYLSQEDFEYTKERLDKEFGQEGKYRKLNELEHNYTWNLGECKVILEQGDKFGPNWMISIQHRTSWYGWLK